MIIIIFNFFMMIGKWLGENKYFFAFLVVILFFTACFQEQKRKDESVIENNTPEIKLEQDIVATDDDIIETKEKEQPISKQEVYVDVNTPRPKLNDKTAFTQWILANTPEKEYYVQWRWDLSRNLLAWGAIKTEEVLYAFLRTPREDFCREMNLKNAYKNMFYRIGYGSGSSITDPQTVCEMTEAIHPEPHHKVLEIGTATGYQSAILSFMTLYVYTIEIVPKLLEETDSIYKRLEKDYPNYKNIKRKIDDGYYGWPEYAPFDRIIVTCAIDHIPPFLIQQMTPDGIMVAPIGPLGDQTLLKITKKVDEDGTVRVEREALAKKSFVPFTSEAGIWKIHEKVEIGDSTIDTNE